MLIAITIQTLVCIFLIIVLYKQYKNNLRNSELSNILKNKESELLEIKINLAKLQGEYDSLIQKTREKDERITNLESTIQKLNERLFELNKSVERVNMLEKQNNERYIEIEKLKKSIDEQNLKIIQLKSQNSYLQGENQKLKEENSVKKSLETQLKEIEIENKKNSVELEEKKKNIQNLMELQEQIKNQFKVISNEIIKEQKITFNKEQNENLYNILSPLNKDIKEFKDKIQQVQDGNNANTIRIEENIKNLLNTTRDIGNKADNLATALKGDKKAQGNWGEFQLQNLLETSGLEEGISFFKQYNVKNSDGKDFFLDFVIKLPKDRILIVDSKVSMVNYEKCITCNSENDRINHLRCYCEDIKNHIKELGAKEYQNIYKQYNNKTSNDTPDFVFMFIAVEGAYIDAIKFDKSIFDVAMKNKVAIVTTSSFMPVLRMIGHLWNIENQNKHISDIIDLSQTLYKKMEKFAKDISTIGDSLDRAKDAYISAKNYVSTGKGNMLSIATKIINIADKTKVKDKLALDFEDDNKE